MEAPDPIATLARQASRAAGAVVSLIGALPTLSVRTEKERKLLEATVHQMKLAHSGLAEARRLLGLLATGGLNKPA